MKDWPYPRLVAHRGGGSLAPENTLAAIRLGQSLGYRAHEFDVKLSKDNIAMLLHDATLERTSTGRGRAADFDWQALKALDAGGWHSPEFKGEPLASFEEAAKLLISKKTMAHIEIKPTPGMDAETGTRVAELTRKLFKDAPVKPLFSSFSFQALMAAKAAAPEIPRGWLTKEFAAEDWLRLEELEAVSMHTSYKTFPAQRIKEVQERGYRVLLYTVNEVSIAEKILAAGADGIFTDNLREFAVKFPGLI